MKKMNLIETEYSKQAQKEYKTSEDKVRIEKKNQICSYKFVVYVQIRIRPRECNRKILWVFKKKKENLYHRYCCSSGS